MLVFVSWSGQRSQAVAQAFRDWLPQVIQAVEPWLSPDIEKGATWITEIKQRLDDAKVGIVCVTQDNQLAPWLLFESGALSKNKEAYVCTFLLDIAPSDVQPPLGQFQHTVFEKNDVFKLVSTINSRLPSAGDKLLPTETLGKAFDRAWPDLETALVAIQKQHPAAVPPKREDREILQEILDIVREQQRKEDARRWMLARMLKETTPPAEQQPGIIARVRAENAAAKFFDIPQDNTTLAQFMEVMSGAKKPD